MFLRNRLFILLSVVVLLCSCGTRKHRYLQAPKGHELYDTLYQKSLSEYRLQSGDILYIKVLTKDEEFADLFNVSQSQTQTASVSNSYYYIYGYPINIEGEIEVPGIGKIHVARLTVTEVEKIVHQKVSEIVYDSQVIVRLAGFRINIVGEVKSPGEYTVYRDQTSVLAALSLAGDMNYYGNRKQVMILRTTEAGTIPYTIDLTDREALSSPRFYLQPNDVIYVQPLPRTLFRVNVTDFIQYLTALSSSLAIVLAILSLTK